MQIRRFYFSIETTGHVLLVCLLFFVVVGESMATIIGKPPAVFGRPACPTCGTRMLLVRIFPDKPGHDQRTFECPRCADEITEVVQSVKADAFH